MKQQLRFADNLTFPLDFVTERIAFLARTGAGKSGGMRVIFEQMVLAKQFGIFIDPKGDAYGIRAGGVGDGLPVLVMGGDHGDVPLEATAGKFIAEFLVTERVPTVLDVSDFGKADMIRFVTELATTLYRRNRDVCHVFIDEADMVAGERFYDPHCLEAIQLIQNKGRHRGFGVTVATQRSAMINKSVLFASGTLIAMQTTSPKDIKTIREWLEVQATQEIAKQIVSQLPTLKTREAIVYSPQTLDEPVRIKFDAFQTFDSMRTPRPGEARQTPKSVADIDLTAVQRDMAATIDKVKANDPKRLKTEIQKLRRELLSAQKANSDGAPAKGIDAASKQTIREQQQEVTNLTKQVDSLRNALRDAMKFIIEINARDFFAKSGEPMDEAKIEAAIKSAVDQAVKQIDSKVDADRRSFEEFKRASGKLLQRMERLLNEDEVAVSVTVKHNEPFTVQPEKKLATPSLPRPVATYNGDISLTKAERQILVALFWTKDDGSVTPAKVGFYADYRAGSGSFNNALSGLRSKGLLASWKITDAGIDLAATFADEKPAGMDLREWLRPKISKCSNEILDVLIHHNGSRLDLEVLAEHTPSQYKVGTGSFNNALSQLRSLEAAEGGPREGGIKAADVFFE